MTPHEQRLITRVTQARRKVEMTSPDIEDLRSKILAVAASCARLQHVEPEDVTMCTLRLLGDHAHTLKEVFDALGELKKES
jgi:hypothetical protein